MISPCPFPYLLHSDTLLKPLIFSHIFFSQNYRKKLLLKKLTNCDRDAWIYCSTDYSTSCMLVSDRVSLDFSVFTASFYFNLPLLNVFLSLFLCCSIRLYILFILEMSMNLSLISQSQYLNVCVSSSLTTKYILNFFLQGSLEKETIGVRK